MVDRHFQSPLEVTMNFRSLLAVAALAALPTVALADGPVTVKLKNGETVTGTFTSRGATTAQLKSAGLGVVNIPVAQIDSIVGPNAVAMPYTPLPEAGLFGTDFLSGWSKSFDLGFMGQNGASESLALNTGLDFATTDVISDYRSSFGARYWLASTDGDKSVNAFRAYGKYDQYIPSVDPKFFIFGYGQYDFDEFQSFYQRVSLYVGPGYDFVKKDNYTMTGRVGVGFSQDFGREATDDFRIEAYAGVDGKWVIEAEKQFFTYSMYYFPSLEDFSDGRIVSNLAYEAVIDQAKGITVRAFFEHKYEFRTPDDTDHNNYKYGLNVGVKF
jgi:putative salt-induced outer membrane protein YdiY